MGYTYDFKNNEFYGAEDINSIRSAFITSGIISGTAPAMAVSVSEGKVFISEGLAVFADGSSLKIDADGVEMEFQAGVKNYVYLLNDTIINKNTVNVSTQAPAGDYLMLAEIGDDGTVSDMRVFASAKYASLGAQRCIVTLTIPGLTNGWDNTQFIYLGKLNVDRNLRCVTAIHRYDYGDTKLEIGFIRDNGVELNLYNSNYNDDVDIKITSDFEVYARAKTNHTATLIFENIIEGTVTYA